MQRLLKHCGLAAAALLPLLLGGCLSGQLPGGGSDGLTSAAGMPAGFGYRPVMRVDSAMPDLQLPAGGAPGQQIALAPDGRMKWIPAPKRWTVAGGNWLVPPQRPARTLAARTGGSRSGSPVLQGVPVQYAAIQTAEGFVLPVSGAVLTSNFGMREHPILGGDRLHAGIDLAAATGTPVRAAVAGTVEAAGRNGGYGNYVRIGHGPISTAYAHLDGYAPGLTAGAAVAAGDIIGYVGSTGRSTGPHLHFEILVGDDAIDPMSVVPAELQVALGTAPRVELARGGR